MHYIIVEARTTRELEEAVANAIDYGYRPVGGVTVSPPLGKEATYLQAMVRDEPARV